MPKFILFFVLLFTFSFGGCSGSDSNNGGGGDDPAIQTAEDLKNISDDACREDFTLTNDIIVDEEWNGLCPDGFTGSFNGGGHTITFTQKINGGMFVYIGDGGTVKDLKVEAQSGVTGVYINSIGANYAGALVGYAGAGTVIDNCNATVSGDIYAEGLGAYAGGLIGSSQNAITKSYATVEGNITAISNGTGYEYAYAGGLAGACEGSINNTFAYVSGKIKAEAKFCTAVAGGLTGYAVNISNSFAIIGDSIESEGVQQAAFSGGIAGVAENVLLKTSFAAVSGTIKATGPTSFAGGAIGYGISPNSIEDCVIVLENYVEADTGTNDIVGTPSVSSLLVYLYLETGTSKNQATLITAGNLESAAWWAGIGYADTDWRLSDGAMPMQAVFPDLDLYTLPG